MSEQRISLSLSGLLTVVGSVLLLVVLWQLRSLLVILMVSVVLAASIAPMVDWAERYRVPRWLGGDFGVLTDFSRPDWGWAGNWANGL